MQKVRIRDKDLAIIIAAFKKHFGPNDRLWLFGSRADLTKRGGDIDLYIETHEVDTQKAVWGKLRFVGELHDTLGEQKIDVV